MEKISEIIKRLCPEGVETVRLDSVCSFTRGNTITAKNAIEGTIPVIAGGQTPSYYHNEANRIGDTVVIAGSGAYAGFVSYWQIPIYVSDAFSIDSKESLHKKYLFYFLKRNQRKIYETQKGAGVPHVHGKDIAGFEIPLPPLSVQQEIVRVLDSFTAMITNLETELASRQKQYEHYRNQLLTFDENAEGVVWKTLGEIAKIARGASPRPIKSYITNSSSGVNWIKIGDVEPGAKYITKSCEKITEEGAKKSRFLHAGDFILSNSMSFGRPYILKIDGCIHDGWISMSGFESYVNSDYMYYVLNTYNIQSYWNSKANDGGAMSNLNSDIVNSTIIPVPSLQRQKEIVEILDTFEALISNIKRELEARKKQYEYYREKLLTFE